MAGLAALAKLLIAMEDKALPANLHYSDPNPDIPGLSDGRLWVVTETTPWSGPYACINSFGFGGSNVHCILKANEREKVTRSHPAAKLPRLATCACRTTEAVEHVLQGMKEHETDMDMHALLQENAEASVATHPYRGFTLLNKESTTTGIETQVNFKLVKCYHSMVYIDHGRSSRKYLSQSQFLLQS